MPHIHEKIDFASDVYIVCNDKVLLRRHDKYNLWLGVGGHVELDEDPSETAIREAKEEVGLDIRLIDVPKPESDSERTELIPPRFMNRHPIKPGHEHVSLIYFATSDTEEVKEGEGEKIGGWQWFRKEELDHAEPPIEETIKYYARAALDAVNVK